MHFTIINGVYGCALSTVSIVILLLRWHTHEIVYDFDFYQWLSILAIGVLSNFANQCTIIACSMDKASRVASLNFLQVLYSYVFDVLLFGYTIGWIEFSGAAIIIACSTVTVVLKYLNYSE